MLLVAHKKMPVAKPALAQALLGTLGAPQKQRPAMPDAQACQLYDPSVVDTPVTMKMPPPAAEMAPSGTPGTLATPAKKPPPLPRAAEDAAHVER